MLFLVNQAIIEKHCQMVKLTHKYKALMIDVDGTLIPNKKDGTPSQTVIKAITKASKKLHVGLATSRPSFMLDYILDQLPLTGPSIINSGSQILDTSTRKIVWEQPLLPADVEAVKQYVLKNNLKAFVNSIDQDFALDETYTSAKTLQIFMVAPENVDTIISDLSHIPTLALHKVPSFTHDKVSLLITHVAATKQHGIFEVAKILDIETHDIIAIGDGYNDFPLLMACGLKVAMGNAVEDLKAIADYVAPPVDEDGVVDVINRFVL